MRSGVLPKIGLTIYNLALMLLIYWLINLSLRSNVDIMSGLRLWPHHPSLAKYYFIFNDATWVHAFGVSLTYVAINTVISLTVALPAAYAFNRYRFVGDKHLFFWLLTNLMAPTAVYAMPFFNLYYAVGLFDTVWAVAPAHCLFNVPLAGVDSRRIHRRRAARGSRNSGDRRLFVPPFLHQDLPAADRQRRRRHRLLLFHVLLG
jgi:glycerol transport system permease protein